MSGQKDSPEAAKRELAEAEEGFKRISLKNQAILFSLWPEVIKDAKSAGKLKGVGKSSVAKIEKFFSGEDITKSSNNSSMPQLEDSKEEDNITPTVKDCIIKFAASDENEGEGISVSEIQNRTSFSEQQVKDALAKLEEGSAIYTVIDDHYLPVE